MNRSTRSDFSALLCRIATSCLFLLVAMQSAMAADTFGDPEYKTVIQVSTDDPQTQRIALNNAANLQKQFGMDHVRVEIVAYGPGLGLLTEQSKLSDRVESLIRQNVRFSACQNTMEAIKRKTGTMPVLLDGVEVVPSGVARIATLESQGYSYIRP